jgi:hypothetical protein
LRIALSAGVGWPSRLRGMRGRSCVANCFCR